MYSTGPATAPSKRYAPVVRIGNDKVRINAIRKQIFYSISEDWRWVDLLKLKLLFCCGSTKAYRAGKFHPTKIALVSYNT